MKNKIKKIIFNAFFSSAIIATMTATLLTGGSGSVHPW